MTREIESLEDLKAVLAAEGALHDVAVQGLDLRELTAQLAAVPCTRAVFFGCRLAREADEALARAGALIFPPLPDLLYRPYRSSLYTAEELYEGYRRGEPASLTASLDQRIYAHYRTQRDQEGGPSILEAMAQRLHDHAIDDALDELLAGDGERRRVVAIMGGHAMGRDERAYRQVARMAQLLAERGYLLASGGGPGAMEATHLGALLAGQGAAALDEAVSILAAAPSYRDAHWLDRALEVRERFGSAPSSMGVPSLGIPTWFYGHEPPNVFPSHMAKYFSNSLREDGLLAIAKHGVIYSPGSAGTIQEIFMDAAQNHYGTFELVSPMVFYGVDYWRREKPVYPLLESLAAGRQYAQLLAIADDPDAIVGFIEANPPVPYRE